MKKALIPLVIFVFCMLMVSCGGDSSDSGDTDTATDTDTVTDTDTDTAADTDTDTATDTDTDTATDTDSNDTDSNTDTGTEELTDTESGDVSDDLCSEKGATRIGDEPCGSTGHGKLYQECGEDGIWHYTEKCTCDPGEYPEVCGYYAQKMWFTSKSKVFTIDLAEGWTRTYFHIVQEQEQDKIHIKATYCNIKIDNSMSSVLQVVMPQSFADALGTADKEAVLTKNDDGTFGYKQDIFWEIRGIDPACYGDKPEDYVLPENSNDPCVQDWDNDGLPGITVTAKGTMSGTMGMVEKSSSIIRDGYFEENGVLKAYVDWTDKQKILYTTNQMLKDGSDNQIKDESSKFDGPANFIEQVKIEDGSDCAFIVNNAGTIFSPDPVNLK